MKLPYFLSFAVVSLVVGCGGTADSSAPAGAVASDVDAAPTPGDPPASTTDAGIHDGQDARADAPIGACNTLDPRTGKTASMALVAKEAPEPAGGSIQDGAYELAEIFVHTGPGGASGPLQADVKWRLEIHGGAVDQAFVCTSGCSTPGPAQHVHATITTSGTTVRSAEACPGSRIHVQSYTATKDRFVFYERNGTGQIVTYAFALAH